MSWKINSGPTPPDSTGTFIGNILDWDPDIAEDEEEEEELQQAEADVGDWLFSEKEVWAWTGKQAVLWITNAGNAFEALGLRPKKFKTRSLLRKRFHKLSLLTHPDKNSDEGAAEAFRKLADAMRILSDEAEQDQLLCRLFPSGDAAANSRGEGIYGGNQAVADAAKLESLLKAELAEHTLAKEADRAWNKNRNSLKGLTPSSRKNSAPLGSDVAKRMRCDKDSAPAWGVPQEFRPPPVSASGPSSNAFKGSAHIPPTGAVAVDPCLIWELTGGTGLAANGWCRMESRSHPGKFYFLHKASGRTCFEATKKDAALLPGWERRESRSKPGFFYYANTATGETSTEPPRADPHCEAAKDEDSTAGPNNYDYTAALAAATNERGGKVKRVRWPWEVGKD